MKKNINFKKSIFIITAVYLTMNGQKALVIVPVADLIGSPIGSFYPHVSTKQGYNLLPLCGGNTNTYSSCPRMHQLLFNETVTILETRASEIRVEIPQVFYITHTSNIPQNSYWMLKKNVITFDELKKNHIDLDTIPDTPSFKNKTTHAKQTITLSMPFIDPITQQIFSAGTRFIIKKKEMPLDAPQPPYVTAYLFDSIDKKLKEIYIPTDIIIKNITNNAQKITQFIKLIKQWAHNTDGFIPYVWGGCSFTTASKGIYSQKNIIINKEKHSYFDLSDYQQSPKTGMDCANLIGRAAQLCDMPYYLKNSLTIATYLKPLAQNEQLENGDIIWIYGHVMVVSDLEQNLLVEARSCLSDGQGRVQEIPLSKAFKGIHNYTQLINMYHSKKPLYRIGKNGNIEKTINGCKLLKLASVWDPQPY